MAIRWQVKFRSLRASSVNDANLFTVNIYDPSYTGSSPVQLTGAAQPFTTEEDNDDDLFAPVRTQSGYLRIVDTGGSFDWRDFIPTTDTDRPVTLTDAQGNVLWAGSMQPQNFGAALYEMPQGRDFPVQCVLSLMQGVNVDYAHYEPGNFALLLQKAVESVPAECRPGTFVFQGGALAKTFLNVLIDWEHFLPPLDDYNERIGYSYYDLLQGMCNFWGWTVRSWGSTLFFTCADDADMTGRLTLTKAQLDSLAAGTDAGTISTDTFDTLTIGDVFASTSNTDYQMRGPARVKVTSNAEFSPAFEITPFDDLLDVEMEAAGWVYGIPYNNTTIAQTNDILLVSRDSFVFTAYSGDSSFNKVRKEDGSTESGMGEAHNVLEIKKSGAAGGTSFLAYLYTTYAHSFSDGFFVFYGETMRGADEFVETEGGAFMGNREMYMAVGIGTSELDAQWWNGRAWQNTFTRFAMSLGNAKPEYFTRYWISQQQAEYTNIITTGKMVGKLFVHFYGSYAGAYGDRSFPETSGQKSFNLKDFQIVFYKNSMTVRNRYPNSYWNDIKEKESRSSASYLAKNGNRNADEYSSDNIFATDNRMKSSYGVLLNTDGSTLEGVSYDGSSDERPEQHKADRIAGYWAASKRKIEASLLATGHNGEVGSISPGYILTIDGTTMYPIAISRDWRDDVVRVTTVEI